MAYVHLNLFRYLKENHMAKRRRRSVFSGIGGQAVLEGVMMRNRQEYAIAVRKPDGSIGVEIKQLEDKKNKLLRKIPLVRGVIAFVESLMLGMDILSYSAAFFDDEEEEEKAGNKKSLMEKLFKDKAEDVVMALTVLFSIAFAILLFMVLPYAVSELLGKYIRNKSLILLIEGALRILIFVLYVAGIALMKDIRRLYQYHGAEHKCINCVETGRPLTVENVMRSSRFHKRCGTSFMLFVVVLGVILCFFIRTEIWWLKIVIRLALVPVIAGIAFELLQLAGKKESFLLSLISTPGLLLQKVTTKEPDESMVEVAIAATEAVFDWEAFQKKHFKTKMVKKTRTEADGREVETGEDTMQIDVLEIEDMLRSGYTGVINRDAINRELQSGAADMGYDPYVDMNGTVNGSMNRNVGGSMNGYMGGNGYNGNGYAGNGYNENGYTGNGYDSNVYGENSYAGNDSDENEYNGYDEDMYNGSGYYENGYGNNGYNGNKWGQGQ